MSDVSMIDMSRSRRVRKVSRVILAAPYCRAVACSADVAVVSVVRIEAGGLSTGRSVRRGWSSVRRLMILWSVWVMSAVTRPQEVGCVLHR